MLKNDSFEIPGFTGDWDHYYDGDGGRCSVVPASKEGEIYMWCQLQEVKDRCASWNALMSQSFRKQSPAVVGTSRQIPFCPKRGAAFQHSAPFNNQHQACVHSWFAIRHRFKLFCRSAQQDCCARDSARQRLKEMQAFVSITNYHYNITS